MQKNALATEFGNAYHEFKSMVSAHLEALPDSEWKRIRATTAYPDWTRETLLAKGLASSNISINDLFSGEAHLPETEILGEIRGEPLFFIRERGVYIWGPSPDAAFTLDLFLSFPNDCSGF